MQVSLIEPYKNDKKNFSEKIAKALNNFGIEAKAEGRNDVVACGAKICGTACFVRGGWSCSHGSLLYDTDLDKLERVLTADDEKLKTKALRSIKSRVKNIKALIKNAPETEGFINYINEFMLNNLCARFLPFDEFELDKINKIYFERYGAKKYLTESEPPYTFKNSRRFGGGKVEIFADVKAGTIFSCKIFGDFLGTIPLTVFENALAGLPFAPQNILCAANVIDEITWSNYFGSVKREEFSSLFSN
ncbi:MAG: hypothetical protein FWE82_09150 [Defluviitaleaceae bacterium]|nr:hypothetical protein [Defluviitaleaceae bacterium]